MDMAKPPVQYVTKKELRALFNAIVLPQIEAGEILETIQSDGLANPEYRQPPGTRSQMVAYWAVGGGKIGPKIALAHRYMRPDGSLGGSGERLPDPKVVSHDGFRLETYPWDPFASTEKG
jgi:hypothetical protein